MPVNKSSRFFRLPWWLCQLCKQIWSTEEWKKPTEGCIQLWPSWLHPPGPKLMRPIQGWAQLSPRPTRNWTQLGLSWCQPHREQMMHAPRQFVTIFAKRWVLSWFIFEWRFCAICKNSGNPNRPLWMQPVEFSNKKVSEQEMLPVAQKKGCHDYNNL